MVPAIKKKFEALERQRAQLLHDLQALSPTQLNRTPAPGQWSVSQVVAHLITAERLSVKYIEKKIQGVAQTGDTGWQEAMKMVVLQISQRLPGLKFKAPRHVKKNTPGYTSLAELEAAWADCRTELAALLEQIPAKYLHRKIYKHPRAGYLNILQGLAFFGEHTTHHLPQIKKLMRGALKIS